MNYIDLSLKSLTREEDNIYLLKDKIKKNRISIMLGAPGSGKSFILQKYKDENNNVELTSVKKFIKLKRQIDESVKILLLDGLDEYRRVADDKTFVLTEIGNKVNDLLKMNKNLKIIITCREMDWRGESDKNDLREEVNEEAIFFSIQPLSIEEQNKLADLLNIDNKDIFIRKFTNKGFLSNPQMFYMLSEIWKNNRDEISSKTNLYKQFIVSAREQNQNHLQSSFYIEQGEMFKIVGYLAFYYVFSGIDNFDNNFIDEISNSEKGYKKELLEEVLKTKIFSEGKFIHRTIAEYTLANYIFKYKLDDSIEISKERIKNLFVKNVKIPTELRGTYAWLCSLSADQDFIQVDPYYQAIHGDNSLFNIEDKKKIILAVKEYSKTNPYFFEFGQRMELEGFYTIELDNFLINEYDKALKFENHYIDFIINIITQSEEISDNLKAFLKEKIEENLIPTYYKEDFIKLFILEPDYLQDVVEKIKSGDILDKDDRLKERILNILYPKYIDHTKISEYLILYTHKRIIGYCNYLYKTEYDNKYELLKRIYELSCDDSREVKLKLPKLVKSFVSDYFLETLLKYDESLEAKEIYAIIEYFNTYYSDFEKIKFESYRYEITDKVKVSEEKLQRLANELFEIYIDKMLSKENETLNIHSLTCDFNYFFSYKSPNNQSEVLLKKMNKNFEKKVNKDLFFRGLNCLLKDENNKPIIPKNIEELIIKYGLEEEFNNWLNPKRQDWEIESQQQEKKWKEEEIEAKRRNEKYFENKSDEEIQKCFGDLGWIAHLFYFDNSKKEKIYLENATLERLKAVLKDTIYNELIEPKLLTLNSLAKDSPSANRNIDIVYYVSLVLNEDEEIIIDDVELKKYLYTNTLKQSKAINIQKSNFIKRLEKNDLNFVKGCLKEYIELLLEEQFYEIKHIVNKYTNLDSNIDNLKRIAMSHGSNLSDIKNSISENFLNIYAFNLEMSDLIELEKLEMNTDNKNAVEALIVFNNNKKENFTIDMATSFHSLIRDNAQELYDGFKNFDSKLRIKIISYMMSAFKINKSIEEVNGIQSPKNECASFLKRTSLMFFDIEELETLSELHSSDDDTWKNKILNKLNELQQQQSDSLHESYKVKNIKKFIFDSAILSKKDFFTEVSYKIEKLKQEIEDNINNDKNSFYSEVKLVKSKKTEEASRDIILQRLNDKYGSELLSTKEQYLADNRLDINVKYKSNFSYQVQIECKRDDNGELYEGIQNQLIDKYFSSNVQYGIYLIFYFRKLKNKSLMLKKVYDSIPNGYEDKIKVICIDLVI
ncbi:NACHT domain-containing NTPase [Psychrilyobacter sp. S5]|uniref:NACHT domain-containing protein n=1 Tax=Psychrilyobacter sp. S5 TaxID=2283384 RepID=UPI002175F996|nr:hypothetical protein [Psychrilyobacter sp. S5]MCS5422844.1 hypothetical protein [Psychrilyobacter sp. S5]